MAIVCGLRCMLMSLAFFTLFLILAENFILSHYCWVTFSLRKLNIISKIFKFTLSNNEDTYGNVIKSDPKIDKSQKSSNEEIFKHMQIENNNLPVSFWINHKSLNASDKNESCAVFPRIFDLEFRNFYWQVLESTNGTFLFLSAYYDNRKLNFLGPSVRILGMINTIRPGIESYCQLWFDGFQEPVHTEKVEYSYMWYHSWGGQSQGIFQPYILTCNVPTEYYNQIPSVVSVVENHCDMPTNALRVVYDKPLRRRQFAVCVKGLDFLDEDISVRLIEWIELLFLLGADKIFFYYLNIHPNIYKVLQYYQKYGWIDLVHLTLPGEQPNIPYLQHLYLYKKIVNKRLEEVIPYNDCFYKNIYSYEYIVVLDVDEVIMPKSARSWKSLFKSIQNRDKNKIYSSYCNRVSYFIHSVDPKLKHQIQSIPKYMHMLQNIYRLKSPIPPVKYYPKCFHVPDRVLALHNHFPFHCLGKCSRYTFNISESTLLHFRNDCKQIKNKFCNLKDGAFLDTSVWKFKELLIKKSRRTLRALKFLQVNISVKL